jgi:4-hydroxybenzoate polyprenyltransferase
MISRSTLVHLRIPFFFFLSPIFLLAVLFAGDAIRPAETAAAFLIVHFLLYTASNGFNSYYDRDESPIGGIRNPPAVTADLLWVSLGLDAAAVGLGLLVSPLFAFGLFLYGLGSKAYSWDRLRLKRLPLLAWLMVGLGQGFCTSLLVRHAATGAGVGGLLEGEALAAAVFTAVLLLGVYPLTQVYQHAEDHRQGVTSLSMLAGVRGTFVVSGLALGVALAGFAGLFAARSTQRALVFLACQAPALGYFVQWAWAVWHDARRADWAGAMRMNTIASGGLNLFCLLALAGLV